MISKSDFRNPIGFFEDWISETNLNSKYDQFVSSLDESSCYIDLEKGLYISTNPDTGEQETDRLIELFQATIRDLLYEKCQESKRLIDDYHSAYQQNKTSLDNYFKDKVKLKIKKITSNRPLFEKFPILLKPLEGVIYHVNNLYPTYGLSESLIADSDLTIPKEFDLKDKSTKERITTILKFLNESSKIGIRFLSEDDYNDLVNSIEMLFNGEKPRLKNQIIIHSFIDNNALNFILKEILFPYLKNSKFKLIHFREFLKSNVNLYKESSNTFYRGTLKVPDIKKYTDKASYIEWWIGRYT